MVNSCTIDWFTEWPRDALEKVATKFLEDLELDDDTRRSCVQVQGSTYFFFSFSAYNFFFP